MTRRKSTLDLWFWPLASVEGEIGLRKLVGDTLHFLDVPRFRVFDSWFFYLGAPQMGTYYDSATDLSTSLYDEFSDLY